MNTIISKIIDDLPHAIEDVHGLGLVQLYMLLMKNCGQLDEMDIEGVLPPSVLSVGLDDADEEAILAAIARRTSLTGNTSELLWAMGKTSPKVGLKNLIGFLEANPNSMDNPKVGYQAIIAIENFLGIMNLVRPYEPQLRSILEKASASPDPKLAEHSARILNRLKDDPWKAF